MLKRKYLWLLMMPQLTFAFSWKDLWFNHDQQGQQLLQNHKNKEAAETFNNEKWKGIAYYKDKQYDKAYTQFKDDKSALGYYNQGNALANMQKYQEAIDAYTQSLKIDKNNQDAQHNIEVLKKLQQQQKDQQKSDSDKSQQNQDKQQDQKSSSNQNQDKQQSQSGDQKNQNQQQNGDSGNKDQQQQKQPAGSNNNQKQQNMNQNQQQAGTNKPEQQQDSQQKATPGKEDKQQQNQQSTANSGNPEQKTQEQTGQKPQQANNINQQAQQDQTNKGDKTAATTQYLTPEQQKQQQELKAALSQVPDDPGGLLRNKFIRDYQKEQQQGGTSE